MFGKNIFKKNPAGDKPSHLLGKYQISQRKFRNTFSSTGQGLKPLRRWEDKYIWTRHAQDKMRYYRLTEARIKRIIRNPKRTEEGVLDDAIACMQPAEGKNYSEIWTMYLLEKTDDLSFLSARKMQKSKFKIITAWRYPGRSPEGDPIPAKILREIRNII